MHKNVTLSIDSDVLEHFRRMHPEFCLSRLVEKWIKEYTEGRLL